MRFRVRALLATTVLANRTRRSSTANLHFRPFGGPALPFDEVVQYLENTGVLFANVYGIGQMLPVNSDCTYYLDCVGTLVSPTMKNDFVNAMNFVLNGSDAVHLTMSMTFPDLEKPDSVLVGMRLLDHEFPGVFSWMGEVNLVKQALFGNFHAVVPLATIPRWAPFMALLRFRGMPLAIHSDLGNDADPTQYLPWIEEVLRLYPHNKIIWMHLGLSRELVAIDPDTHIGILESLLDRYPNLMVDISWRVIDDNVFSDPGLRERYIPFLNAYSDRILPARISLHPPTRTSTSTGRNWTSPAVFLPISTMPPSGTLRSGRTISGSWALTTWRRRSVRHPRKPRRSAMPRSRRTPGSGAEPMRPESTVKEPKARTS